ncbi:MAG: AraC family transcriptional regulator [Bacteroidota bacterium]
MNITDLDKILSFVPITEAAIFCLLFITLFRVHQQRHFLFIALYKFFLMAFFSMTFMFYYKIQSLVAISFYFTIPTTLALLPLFYLYADCLTTPCKSFNIRGWFHFLPSIVAAIALIPYLFVPSAEKVWFVSGGYGSMDSDWIIKYVTWIFRFGVLFIVYAQLLVYLFLFNRLLKRHKKSIEHVFSYKENIDLRWLFNLLLGFILFFVAINLSRYFGIRHDIYHRMIFNIGFVAINLYIGIKGVIQPNVYSLIKNDDEIAENLSINNLLPIGITASETNREASIKYSTSKLSDEIRSQILSDLIVYMKKKPFHKFNFNIEDIAEELNTNTRYVSQVINETYQMNFFNYINQFRIEEAKVILQSSKSDKYTIEGIAKMVGFNSKSSFNGAFKKTTGFTPSEFKMLNNKIEVNGLNSL